MKYYLHSSNSFSDEKIHLLFMRFGYEGLGLFYTALEQFALHEKPIRTDVLKHQLKVGKKLEKCWKFMEEIGILSSNNGETFNENLLKFSEKYRIKNQKNRERVAQHRKNKELSENVMRYNDECNTPKDKLSKVNINNIYTEKKDSDVTELKPEKKITRREPEPHPVNDFIKKEYPDTIAKMPVQMTAQHCDKIVKEYGAEYVKKVFARMDSWEPLNRKRKDVYRTFQTFAINGNEKK